jgi:hypothetical protein
MRAKRLVRHVAGAPKRLSFVWVEDVAPLEVRVVQQAAVALPHATSPFHTPNRASVDNGFGHGQGQANDVSHRDCGNVGPNHVGPFANP